MCLLSSFTPLLGLGPPSQSMHSVMWFLDYDSEPRVQNLCARWWPGWAHGAPLYGGHTSVQGYMGRDRRWRTAASFVAKTLPPLGRTHWRLYFAGTFRHADQSDVVERYGPSWGARSSARPIILATFSKNSPQGVTQPFLIHSI